MALDATALVARQNQRDTKTGSPGDEATVDCRLASADDLGMRAQGKHPKAPRTRDLTNHSLAGWKETDSRNHRAVKQSQKNSGIHQPGKRQVAQMGNWKLVHNRRGHDSGSALFDLGSDIREEINLAEIHVDLFNNILPRLAE